MKADDYPAVGVYTADEICELRADARAEPLEVLRWADSTLRLWATEQGWDEPWTESPEWRRLHALLSGAPAPQPTYTQVAEAVRLELVRMVNMHTHLNQTVRGFAVNVERELRCFDLTPILEQLGVNHD